MYSQHKMPTWLPAPDGGHGTGAAWLREEQAAALGVVAGSWVDVARADVVARCRVQIDQFVPEDAIMVDALMVRRGVAGGPASTQLTPLFNIPTARRVVVRLERMPRGARTFAEEVPIMSELLLRVAGMALSAGLEVRGSTYLGVIAVDRVEPTAAAAALVTNETIVDIAEVSAAAPPLAEDEIDREDPHVAGLLSLLELPMRHGHLFESSNLRAPGGVLLYGPPGVGKTHLVRTVSAACGAHLVSINGPEILSPYPGESERRLRERFDEATRLSSDSAIPCVLFIDELDALCPPRGSSGHTRVVAELLTLLDGAHGRSVRRTSDGRVVVVAATNRPNHIDAALRRPGRLDREMGLSVPSVAERRRLLSRLTRRLPLAPDVDLADTATKALGFVGADLAALVRTASLQAVRAHASGENVLYVTASHFEAALLQVQPSTLRGGEVVEVDPLLTWADVGGLDDVKLRLRQAVEWPVKHATTYARLGLRAPRGVLLHGPPGCSKTTLVRVMAATSGCSFFALSGAAVYSPYVGDAEKAVRDVMSRARASAPAMVFFDELDAIVGNRENNAGGGDGGVSDRVLATMLNEMDGIEAAEGVLVVGATNRLDAIDAALLRPGRFDEAIYVPPPDRAGRLAVFQVYTRKMQVASDVDLEWLADSTNGYTGADIQSVCREAAFAALRRSLGATHVSDQDFNTALDAVRPSLQLDFM